MCLEMNQHVCFSENFTHVNVTAFEEVQIGNVCIAYKYVNMCVVSCK